MNLAAAFRPDYIRYDGVRPIQILLMRIGYVMVFVFVGPRAWLSIMTHDGPWDPYLAAALSMWASSSLLSLLGVLQPLRMLPLFLFEIGYKLIFLAAVSWPLWSANRLTGVVEGLTYAFLAVVFPTVLMPWGYVLRTCLRAPRRDRNILGAHGVREAAS